MALLLVPAATAAQDDDPMRPSIFTMTTTDVVSIDPLERSVGPGSGEVLGRELVFVVEATDPRLSGTLTQVMDIRAFPIDRIADIQATVWSGALRIDNEDGAWVGTFDGYQDGDFGQEWSRLTGEGAYAGLTAILRYDEGTDIRDGVIIPGTPPDYPAPVIVD